MYDTVKGSDWLGDQDAIHYMCREAPRAVRKATYLFPSLAWRAPNASYGTWQPMNVVLTMFPRSGPCDSNSKLT